VVGPVTATGRTTTIAAAVPTMPATPAAIATGLPPSNAKPEGLHESRGRVAGRSLLYSEPEHPLLMDYSVDK
jgi:hypothetical protein